jgi:hypothetical protein
MPNATSLLITAAAVVALVSPHRSSPTVPASTRGLRAWTASPDWRPTPAADRTGRVGIAASALLTLTHVLAFAACVLAVAAAGRSSHYAPSTSRRQRLVR